MVRSAPMVLVGVALVLGGLIAAATGILFQLQECSILVGGGGVCAEQSIIPAVALVITAVGILVVVIGIRAIWRYR